MLTIRMQRTGRKGHAQFRVVVQDSRFHPSSGRVVAYLGNHNPHSKQSTIDKDKIESYLANGAQPSPRLIKLLKTEKVKLPEWVKEPAPKKKEVRNPDKRRSTRPEGVPEPEAKTPAAEEPSETPAETEAPAEKAEETAEETPAEAAKPEAGTEQPAEETPAPETPPETGEAPEKPAA